MSLVSVQELSDYMSGITMTEPQKRSAQVVLDGVEADLEMHINRSLGVRAVREVVHTEPNGFAYLSQTPVWEIRRVAQLGVSLSVTINTGVVDPETILPFPDGNKYDLVPANFGKDLIVPGGMVLGVGGMYFTVDYLAGGGPYIAPYLNSIKKGILHVAARDFQHMHNDRMTVNGQGQPGDPTDPVPVQSKGWTEAELAQFDRIRRRVIL